MTATQATHVIKKFSWENDRCFYTGMAVAMAVTVFAGFAPTYFLKFLIVLSQPIRLFVSQTPAWLAFGDLAQGVSASVIASSAPAWAADPGRMKMCTRS
jgi:hypothetical protein